MKRISILLIYFLSFLSYAEYFSNMVVDIHVNDNGVVSVHEAITYIPSNNHTRGILRVIPYKYSSENKYDSKIAIDNFHAKYLDYNDKLEYSSSNESNVLVYRLGSQDKYLKENTAYTYDIKYDMYNVLRKKDGITQIYFNPIGNFWDMPIEQFIVRITGIQGEIQASSGYIGEDNKDFEIFYDGNSYTIKSTRPYNPREGLSFLINSDTFDYSQDDIKYNRLKVFGQSESAKLSCILLIIPGIIFTAFKFLKGKKSKKTYAVEYMPPEDIDPTVVKLFNKTRNYLDTTIIITKLAQKNLIKKNEKDKLYLDTDNIDTDKLDEYERISIPYLTKYKNNIVSKSNDYSSLESELNKKSYNEYMKYFKLVGPNFKNILIFLMYSIILLGIIYIKVPVVPVVGILITAVLLFVNLLPVAQKKDIYFEKEAKINGFKKFLQTAEAKRFEYFTQYDDIVKYFNKILPYALALNLKNECLKLMNDVLVKYNYNDNSFYSVYPYYFINDITQYNSVIQDKIRQINDNFGKNSTFSGSHSSGSSSGGGFGGGGGSSW